MDFTETFSFGFTPSFARCQGGFQDLLPVNLDPGQRDGSSCLHARGCFPAQWLNDTVENRENGDLTHVAVHAHACTS